MAGPLTSLLYEVAGERKNLTFIDPFCGSGVVSRIAKTLNMNVIANDNEYFSYLVNSVYLSLEREDLSKMFSFMGGIDAYYSLLNMSGLYAAQSGFVSGKPFLSTHYAPKNSQLIEEGRERVFYSRENALFIDAVRNEVQESFREGKMSEKEKMVAISSLLYQSLRVANISGTFTSYHKHIVGKGDGVKKRVSEEIELAIPYLLSNNETSSQVYHQDALSFVTQHQGDIIYLDPPSHPQQYGSAYHLLNSLALWDDFVPSSETKTDGSLIDVSGIRDDWKKTKSPFCSLKESYKAFVTLINRVDAPHIIVSYPSDGILSIDELYAILSLRHEAIRTISIPKTKKGGRSPTSKMGVSEHLFIIGKDSSISHLFPHGIEFSSKIAHIDSFKDSIFLPIEETIRGFSFIEGIYVKESPDYKEYGTYSSDELDTIITLFEKHVIKDSIGSVSLIIEVYTRNFSNLINEEKVKLEKRLVSLLRLIGWHEKERREEALTLINSLQPEIVGVREYLRAELSTIIENFSSSIEKNKEIE
ncbi:MAG: hypothetical protein EOM67_02620 [Spirochaetia bacterium]|nr:hypothetical protein [Spirochaetia bacterium]